MNGIAHCPDCGFLVSPSGKRGFNPRNAVIGDALFGGDGALLGFLGANKTLYICPHCGCRFTVE